MFDYIERGTVKLRILSRTTPGTPVWVMQPRQTDEVSPFGEAAAQRHPIVRHRQQVCPTPNKCVIMPKIDRNRAHAELI